MFYQKSRELFIKECDVTTVLAVINRHQGYFSNDNKRVGCCGWADEPDMWYVRFYATDKKWGRMAAELSEIGEIAMKVSPAGITELYFNKGKA